MCNRGVKLSGQGGPKTPKKYDHIYESYEYPHKASKESKKRNNYLHSLDACYYLYNSLLNFVTCPFVASITFLYDLFTKQALICPTLKRDFIYILFFVYSNKEHVR